MKEQEKEVPTEEKLAAEALRKTKDLFKRISENPQGGGITLENSSDNLAVLYRALLREKATRKMVEDERDALGERLKAINAGAKAVIGSTEKFDYLTVSKAFYDFVKAIAATKEK